MLQGIRRLVVYATTDGQTDDIVRQRRFMMAAGVYFAASLVFAVFAVAHLFGGNWYMLCLNLGFLTASLTGLWLLYRKRILDIPLWICSLAVAIFILGLIWHDQNRSFALGWVFPFPVFLLPLLGLRIGAIAGGLFLVIINVMSWGGLDAWNHGHWDILSAARVSILSVFFYVLALLVEASYLRTARRLELSRAREKTANRNLRRRAVTDALTGLHNRRYFDERLEEEIARVRRHDCHSGILLLDIDHFKSINDNFGHLEGDKVLVRVGDVLKARIRESDVIARWGGEEFAILLPDSGLEQTREIGEKLREAIERTAFETGVFVTLSVGISVIAPNGGHKDKVLGQADRSLYQAKKMGRNRVGETDYD